MSNVQAEFWMVWNPAGRNPTHRHFTFEAAKSEAYRLSKQHPGHDFFVLKAVGGYSLPAPGPQAIIIDDGIPF